MTLDSSVVLDRKANELLCWIEDRHDQYHGFGSMTCAVYDTAWVSMVSKRVKGELQWLFPETFQYVLSSQEASGGWTSGTSRSDIDSILNSMAALLALRRHASALGPNDGVGEDLLTKMYRGAAFLQTRLQSWDVESTAHVGFEFLVPALLDDLEREGLIFEFAGREMLLELKDRKMAKFQTEMLYSHKSVGMTLVHSLEAFAGKIDFDQVAHHKVHGSMMGSPASTAAYLIHSSSWDDEAEEYLRQVISAGPGQGSGGLPSAFPSSLFEMSWVINTLFTGGFDVQKLGEKISHDLRDVLQTAFKNGSGLIGFAPFFGTDADDTAKGITALKALGTIVSVEGMVKAYEGDEFFKTYHHERNPSFTTNCNVLMALLGTPRPIEFEVQIEKIVRYICKLWDERENGLQDKWSISPLYPTMLMIQALAQALVYKGNRRLAADPQAVTEEAITRILWEVLICTLQTQKEDGSWDNAREITAYAVLTINALIPLPIASPFRSQMDSAIARARQYLWPQLDNEDPEYLWIEKVTYGAYTLSRAYILAALHCSAAIIELPHLPGLLIDDTKHTKIAQLYSKMPLLSTTPEWCIRAWQVQANFFSSHMGQFSSAFLPRRRAGDSKYVNFIQFSWVAGNNLIQPAPLTSGILLNMMEVFSLGYQVDEIMEGSVALQPESYLAELKDDIDKLFDSIGAEFTRASETPDPYVSGYTVSSRSTTESDSSMSSIPEGAGENEVRANRHDQPQDRREKTTETNSMCPTEIIDSLSRIVRFVLLHPNVQNASEYDRGQLRINFREFLQAHLIQTKDSRQLHAKADDPSTTGVRASPSGPYPTWVRGTAANSGGGPFLFSFLLCLLGKRTDCFETCEAKFIADDVSRHMSTAGRMYNDAGSLARDRREGNLNSVDFAEFRDGRRPPISERALTDALLRVAGYEQRCRDAAMAELGRVCDGRVYAAVRVLCDVTDLYGQMYVRRPMEIGSLPVVKSAHR